jgi:hypothetical protein
MVDWTTIGSGLLGMIGSKMTADAQTEANQANIAARAANQEKGMQGLTGGSAFQTTTRTPEGGFNVDQVGGADAAKARGITSFGDIARAGKANKLTDFDFTLPTQRDAQGVVDRDIGRRQGSFDKGVNTLLEAQRQKFGGVNNTGELPNTIDALSRFSDQNKFNRERDAIELFQKSRSNDLANVNAQLGNLTARAPAPVYTAGTPGATAAQLIAQTPPATQIADLGGAAPFMGGQAMLKDIQNQNMARENNKVIQQLLNRQMGNQQAWPW